MSWRTKFNQAKVKETAKQPWIRKTGLVLAVLFGVFCLALFFGGPPLLKSYLTDSLSRKLGRKLNVGAVHVNPLALSVSIDDFSLAERDGKTPFVAFKQFYVNAQLASIVFGCPVLSEVRLTEPTVHLVRTADNTYNFQDILDRLGEAPAEPKEKDSKPLRFSLNNIVVGQGRIDFDDRPKGRRHEIRDLNVALPFLSNLFYRVDDYINPAFSAVVNGAPLRLTGQSKPFEAGHESSLDLKLNRLVLGAYLTYVPKKLHFTLPEGKLDADLKITFVQPKGKAPLLKLTGNTALHDLALNEAEKTPTVRLKKLDVVLGSIEPLVKRFTVDRVSADGLELFVRRDRQGRINLANLTEPDKEKTPLPYFLVREFVLNASAVHVRDEQRARPFETTLSDLRLLIRNLTSERGKAGQVELSASGPGKATLEAAADVALEPLAVSKLNVQVADLRVPQPGGKTDIVRIGRFGITGGAFDLDGRRIAIDELSLAESRFDIQRNRKGELNLSELTGGGGPKAEVGAKPETGTETEAKSSAAPWQYGVKKVALEDIGVHWRDETPPAGTAEIGVEKIQGTVENISSEPNARLQLALKARTGRTGQVGVEGGVILNPSLSAKLQLKAGGVPILPVQPYFADRMNIRITNGAVSARGSLAVQREKEVKVQYQGEVQVNRFASVDNYGNNDFLKWETLHVGGIHIATEPLKVAIAQVSLSSFYSRLIINPDGTLNVQHVLGKGEESRQAVAGRGDTAAKPGPAKEAAVQATDAAGPSTTRKSSPPAPIQIARVTLQGGRVNFSDRFIKPNYSANLTQIGGRISGLSSNLASTADVEIRGKVDDAAPVEILGKINPLSGNLFLDLSASAKGVDLPTATPYSAHYAGYPILKGKLSMDVKYRIENRLLRAENRVMLDQLTFGDKVESPKATKLPVLLAVALLKDRNGVIDVNLPIAGSLDDPQFSVGGIIIRVIVNLITKAVTAPFALLGSLFGGGEELSFIEFEPGRSALDKTAQDKIASLVKALENRPALKLDVTGRVDPETDREGLRRRSLERKVKAVKFQKLAARGDGPSSLDEVRVEPAEYPKLLKQVYSEEKFPKPRNVVGLAKDLPVPEMEKLLLANASVSDDALRQLGIRRARVVADAIVKPGGIAADRVFVLEPRLKAENGEKGPVAKARSSRVDFSLK